MANEEQKDIVPSKKYPFKIIKHRITSFLRRREMDSVAARQILQCVVDTHEDTLNDNTDLSRAGLYSMEEVWEALKLISLEVFNKHGGDLLKNFVIKKNTGREELLFAVYEENGKPISVAMQLGANSYSYNYLMVMHVPLKKPNTEIDRFFAGTFIDKHSNQNEFSSLYGEGTLGDYKKSLLGFRWLAYNLLNWDNDFKFPEDLKPARPKPKELPATT